MQRLGSCTNPLQQCLYSFSDTPNQIVAKNQKLLLLFEIFLLIQIHKHISSQYLNTYIYFLNLTNLLISIKDNLQDFRSSKESFKKKVVIEEIVRRK